VGDDRGSVSRGAVRLTAGTAVTVNAYQTSGANRTMTGTCTITMLSVG